MGNLIGNQVEFLPKAFSSLRNFISTQKAVNRGPQLFDSGENRQYPFVDLPIPCSFNVALLPDLGDSL